MKRPNQRKILREIYRNLWRGYTYDDPSFRSYLNPAMFIEEGTRGWYIFWSHYGSSANRASLKSLRWIIEVIFDMKPSEFMEKYRAFKD